VAGAMKDRGRAQLVGARSFGKGSVQTLLNLGHGGALKLTTALYYTPSGETTQAQGVSPHVTIDPGYVDGLDVLKESDLTGHLLDEQRDPKNDDEKAGDSPVVPTLHGAPPSNDELHLGVARTIPVNPSSSGDVALRVAYGILTGTTSERSKPKTSARPAKLNRAPIDEAQSPRQ